MTPRELWESIADAMAELAGEALAAWEHARHLGSAAWEAFLDTPIETWAIPVAGVAVIGAGVAALWSTWREADDEDRRILCEERGRERARRVRELERPERETEGGGAPLEDRD